MWNTLLPHVISRAREMLKIPWVVARENTPISPRKYGDTALFALITTWHDEDIVYASVKNAFAQGCDRVFIVDNNSPDNTVQEALAAGALLARSYHTQQLDERVKIRIVNEVILDFSESADLKTIWWLWLDADEFPEGPDGLSLKEFLCALHPKFRVVGAKNVNHFPVDTPYYVPRFHPLEFQPWCEDFIANEWAYCGLGHWKHPLTKYVRDKSRITRLAGPHTALCTRQLVEPSEGTIIHHFPYRDKGATHRRLEAACAPGEDGIVRVQKFEEMIGHASGIRKRYRTLENVYSGRWDEVDNLHLRPPTKGLNLRLCESAVAGRWYSDKELLNAKGQTQSLQRRSAIRS